MINQIKFLIKLMPFAYRCRFSTIGMIVLCILGIVLTLVFPGTGMGALFLMMGPICMSQPIVSLTVSDLVQTSSHKKALQTSYLMIMSLIVSVISYVVVILLDEINRHIYPDYTDAACVFMRMSCSFIVVVYMLYISFCYKYFIISSIAFFIGVEAITMSNALTPFIIDQKNYLDIPLPLVTILGFVVICISSLMQYGITYLLYKKPLSKTAQFAGLRKQM